MGICYSGLKCNVREGKITILVKEEHPLLQLSSMLDWQALSNIVLPDLQSTTAGGKWWLGRKLILRLHLGAYMLQQLYNKTDRQIEYDIKDNAAFQLFCGRQIVSKWHFPDHTKIEEFRSRLSPDTQQKIANTIASRAVKLGFAKPNNVDIDSTVQEANMSYPSDATLLCKLSTKIKKVVDYVNKNISPFNSIRAMIVDLKKIKSVSRKYFFASKDVEPAVKNTLLKNLYECVKSETSLAISNLRCLYPGLLGDSPWNILRAIKQIINLAPKYLADVEQFINTGKIVTDKTLSFHLNAVKCFVNNKTGGQKYLFGRRFQLARIVGNFIFIGKCTTIDMNDKDSVKPMITLHKKLFKGAANSVTTDKGYYSKRNEQTLEEAGVKIVGMQQPGKIKNSKFAKLTYAKQQELINRRSGIEPLIGHIKHRGQLKRSRMKTDKTIESSGYSSVLSFNLRQLIRHKVGKFDKKAA